jgi:hypothetical protein
MAKIILHINDEQRRRGEIDIHALGSRGKRNNPLLLSWAHEAQSFISADLIHGTPVAAWERRRASRSPNPASPMPAGNVGQTSARIWR